MSVPITTLNLPLLADISLPLPQVYPSSFFEPPSPNPPTPLTPIVQKARELIDDVLPAWAVNHSYRVYAFGLALAEHAGWTKLPDWDVEVRSLPYSTSISSVLLPRCVLT